MKKCGKCLKEKNLSEFYTYKNKVRHWCKECDKINTIIRQRIFKEKCVNYKGGKCQSCGYNKYFGALEFHHIDPSKKDFGIASKKLRIFDNKVKEELDKCELLCANCHREKHQKYETEIINGLWEFYQKQREKHNLSSKLEYESKCTCFCGNTKSPRAEKCKQCFDTKALKRDINEVLDKLKANNYNWCKTAREYHLSDNGLRKFVSSYGYKPKELKGLI